MLVLASWSLVVWSFVIETEHTAGA